MAPIDLQVTPATPRPGEPVLVDVVDTNGHRVDDRSAVSINGIPGASQYLQFDGVGDHLISASQGRDPVNLARAHVRIPATGDHDLPTRFPILTVRPAATAFAPYQLRLGARDSRAFTDASRRRAAMARPARPLQTPEIVQWQWDFGDGATQTSSAPEVTHDFAAALSAEETQRQFLVTCTTTTSDGLMTTARRTLNVVNAYGVCRALGTVAAPVVSGTPARKGLRSFEAAIQVRNLESHDVVVTERMFEYDDGSGSRTSEVERLASPIVLAAATVSDVPIVASFDVVPPWAGQITVILLGEDDGRRVHIEAPLTVPLADRRLAGPGLGAVAIDPRVGNVATPRIARRAPGGVPSETHPVPVELTAPREGEPCDPDHLPDDTPAGWACQVARDSDGTVRETEWHRHAQFANARKGDLILAPGGPAGFIGGLLSELEPAQLYAHMGIMTRDYDLITHCTFSQDRLQDHPVGRLQLSLLGTAIVDEPAPLRGFRSDVLRFGWPGAITQWVSGATDTGRIAHPSIVADPTSLPAGAAELEVDARDPETGTAYRMAPFDAYPKVHEPDNQWVIVPPLVVKPHMAEDHAVRGVLHHLADACRAETGRSYYSFYAYTDASEALSQTASAPGQWYDGTYPSVCSSFVWAVARRQGLHLEAPRDLAASGDLEADDLGRVKIDGQVPDGLYSYSEAERRTAAEYLYGRVRAAVIDELQRKVRDAIGDLGNLDEFLAEALDHLTEIADRVAHQLCNSFANGHTDEAATTSAGWRTPGTGTAVSPDNMLRWDRPSDGGLWGTVVPAVYVPATVERAPAYAWHHTPDHGAVVGTVTVDGVPTPHVVVQATDQGTTTGAGGAYRLTEVPFGPSEITAHHDRGDGVLYSGTQHLDHRADGDRVDFDLRQPRSAYRRMNVSGSHYFMKYYVIGRNPRTEPPISFHLSEGISPEPSSMSKAPWADSDFHKIFGISTFFFEWRPGGAVQWAAVWVVSQDSTMADKVAWGLGSAIDSISLGFVNDLFGGEVNGAEQRGGLLQPGESVHDSIRIGAGDRTNGLLDFTIENLPVDG